MCIGICTCYFRVFVLLMKKLETKQNPMTQDTETQRVLSYGDRIQVSTYRV